MIVLDYTLITIDSTSFISEKSHATFFVLVRLYNIMQHMKKLLFILILFTYLFFSCESEVYDNGVFPYGTERDFELLRNYRSIDEKLTIRIDSIHDSRCPIGATCIWQGEARVYMTVRTEKDDQLVLSTYNNQKDTIQNYEIVLTDVLPYPDLSLETPPDDKTVILKINELAD